MSGPALKDLRADLTAHLADGLDASAPKIGQLVHPPAVVVQAGSPYVEALDYCTDAVTFEATVIAPPGDPEAVVDALDDMVDLIRATLRTQSALGATLGFVYGFRGVSGFTTWPSGDETLPAVTVTVRVERRTPDA